ncbi:MAG: Mfa1 fimbrilin C-terminal domain-containing protein [Tidjanibacter sp.]|nr:Mfa1 fimbrilin C-terminal domain-containing protein [Tidjanibacter sp.]
MKRFPFIIALLGLFGCDTTTEPVSPIEKGELERSYLSVSLKSDDTYSRAGGGDEFEYGEADERYVENVHFFLFKSDKTAFPVNGTGGRNYLSLAIESNGTQPGESGKPNEGPNVSDVKDKVLVFNNYKGEYPTHIVAVLNWDARHIQPSYTLDALYNTLANIRNDKKHFVMSNSVYADMQGEPIVATPLTIRNIGKTEAEAMANPVEIYVERLSAKVDVVAKGDVADKEATYDVEASVDNIPVYAKVLKWDLYNDYPHSILLKHIYPDRWGMGGEIGFLWNDPNRFRSYWAASYVGSFPQENNFSWADGYAPNADVAYCGENTRQAVLDDKGNITSNPRTKVIINAQLVKESGEPIEVAVWYGHRYNGAASLLAEIATLLSSELCYLEGGEYKAIGASDIIAVEGNEAPAGADVEAYEVFFQLSEEALAKEWFVNTHPEGYVAATAATVNARLLAVEPALLYKNGMTYYYTDVKHLGSVGSDSEFGIVRNHAYKVKISQISGLGTPVFDEDTDIDTPERPKEVNSYVAAEVRILSWKVVKNEYDVE